MSVTELKYRRNDGDFLMLAKVDGQPVKIVISEEAVADHYQVQGDPGAKFEENAEDILASLGVFLEKQESHGNLETEYLLRTGIFSQVLRSN